MNLSAYPAERHEMKRKKREQSSLLSEVEGVRGQLAAGLVDYYPMDKSNREKEMLEIAKEVATKKFGKEVWNNNKPYKAELKDDTWYITGTLYYEMNGKRYKYGDANEDNNPSYILGGGTIEVTISNKKSEVLAVYCSR